MWRWLREKRYWIAYYLAYPISVGILAVLIKPTGIFEWAAIVTVSAGIATGFAIAVEVIGTMVLLIPSRIRQIHQEGLKEGIQQGIQQGSKEANAQWRAWLERKQETEAAGLSFNEPPPDEDISRGG